MKKNLIVVSVLALALILSPLSGIGLGVSADEGNTPAVLSVSGNQGTVSGNQGSVSGDDVTPTATPAPTDPTETPAPTDPTETPAPTDPTETPAPTDPTETPAPTTAPVDQIVDELNKVLDENSDAAAEEVVAALREAVDGDIAEIGTAMTESREFRDKVESLEKKYAEEKGITIKEPVVTDAAKQYVDSGKVGIVGAAFNASPGTSVKLWMDEAEKPDNLKELPGNYKTLALDITAYYDEFPIEGITDMPMTITMSVPAGFNAGRMEIRHYAYHLDTTYDTLDFVLNDDGTISFSVISFSTFAFIEAPSSSEPGTDTPSTPSKGTGSNTKQQDNLESLIASAAPGTIVRITKEQNINSLSNGVMKQLVKRGDVALEMEYTYNGVDYHIIIPAGLAENNDIPWYGPLYLSSYYSNYAVNANFVNPVSSVYVVQRGDTLSRIARRNNTTVAKLAAVNPQIKNVNRIMPGQIITIQ